MYAVCSSAFGRTVGRSERPASRRNYEAPVFRLRPFVFILLFSIISHSLDAASQPTVRDLMAQLADADPLMRAQAADRLGLLGDGAVGAASALVKALGDEAWFVRTAAATALGRIPAAAKTSIPALAAALKDEGSIADEEYSHRPETPDVLLTMAGDADPQIAWRALIALGRYVAGAGEKPVGKEDRAAIGSALARKLHHQERLLRDAAGDAFADLGVDVAVSYLSGPARRGSVATRVSAALSLGRVAPQAGGDACLRIWTDSMRNAPEEVWQAYTDTWWRQAEAEMAGMKAGPAKLDPGWPVRAAAARALKQLGAEAKGAVGGLVTTLDDKSWQARLAAVEALAAIDTDGASAAGMGRPLRAPERQVRRAAGEALLGMGERPTIAACVEAFKHPSVTVRTTAAEVIARIGAPAGNSLPAILKATDAWKLPPADWHTGDHDIAILLLIARCCEAAAAIGPAGAGSVPELLNVMRANSKYCADRARLRLRPYFARALGSLSKEGTATQALVEAFVDKDRNVRRCAIQSLGEVGPKAQDAVPRLLAILGSTGGGEVVIEALGKIGRGAAAAVPALTRRLLTTGHRDRECAAEALGRIGEPAREAIPSLAKAVRDPVADVRWYALHALGQIDPGAEDALDAIRWALHEDRHRHIRAAAVEALLRAKPETALRVLREGLSSERWGTRTACAEGLGLLGQEAAPAVADLGKALADEDRDVRRAAAESLGKIGSAASVATPALEKALTDFHRRVRRAAAESLVALNHKLPDGYEPDAPVRK